MLVNAILDGEMIDAVRGAELVDCKCDTRCSWRENFIAPS
jgi:hypothetical protein